MSSESADEMSIVVDVEADPRAARPGPVRVGSIRWLVPLLVLIAVVAGIVIGRSEPAVSHEPPVVRGLAEKPSFVWQRALGELQTATAVGDTVAIHPSEWHGDELVVQLLDPADGRRVWSVDLGEHVPELSTANVLVRDLPGTDQMTVTVVPWGSTSQQTMLISASTGQLVDSLELPANTLLTTTDRGRFVMLTGEDLYGEIAWLGDHPDLTDPLWRVEFELPGLSLTEADVLRFTEHGSYVGIGVQWWAMPSSPLFEVWDMRDGEQIHEWNWTSGSSYHFVSGSVVVGDGVYVSAYDATTGDELWQIEACRCRLYALGEQLVMMTGEDLSGVAMHLLDPRDGSVIWETGIPRARSPRYPGEYWPRIVKVGEKFVDIRSTSGNESEAVQTCITPVDGETGAAGTTRCLDDVSFPVAWPGEDQLILGHESGSGFQSGVLTAMALPGIETRWSFMLPSGTGRIDLVDSRLVIYDQVDGIVGALG